MNVKQCAFVAVLLVAAVCLVTLANAGCVDWLKGEAGQEAKLLNVVSKLKATRVISIQDCDKINAIDQEGMRGVWGNSPVNEYDRNYAKRLKEYLGIDLIIVRSKELLEEMGKVGDTEAKKLAELWINEATEVKNVTRKDIIRAATLCLAFKALIKKYDAAAITYESATLTLSEQKVKAWTPLAILELSKEHIPCCCQSHVDCLVTQTIGTYITDGSVGFVGDVLNDWAFEPTAARPENVVVIGHCGAPITPHGDDRIPYLIRDHIHSNKKWFGPEDIPTATTVQWPTGQAASIIKFDVYRWKVSVFTGTVLDGNSLYKDFANCICRNKIVIRIDNPEHCYMLPSDSKEGAFRNWWGSWGCHQVVFYGDHRQKITDFAALTGFEVVE